MKRTSLPIRFDLAFMEEAVFLAVMSGAKCGAAQRGRFHAEKNKIYELTSPEKKEEKFRRFYEVWFSKLGLKTALEKILKEFPAILSRGILVFMKRAVSSKDEGAELYVEGSSRTVLIGLQVIRLLEPALLEAILRHELLHIVDMLDTEFQYSPSPLLGGGCEAENNLIRDRFSLLWNLCVSSRIERKGWLAAVPLQKQRRDFDRVFSSWGTEKRDRVFAEITSRGNWTQPELLELAHGPHPDHSAAEVPV